MAVDTVNQMPQWVLAARKFIATGRQEFLREATDACEDPEIRALLSCRELAENERVPPEQFQPLAESLRQAERAAEATTVELLGLRIVALQADSPERYSAEIGQFTLDACNRTTSIAQEAAFSECEALFAGTLGTRAGKLQEREQAVALLGHVLDLYRSLVADEPRIYRPNVAATLNNLGNVLQEMCQFPASRASYEEALAIRRELAVDEPSIYRSDVAGTLNNLGAVFDEMHQFPASRASYEEALAIRRELAADEPRTYRPDVAGTLNNLGNVLREMRQFPASRAACEESLAIRRELMADEPRIYQPDVAGTLHNLGNTLAEMRQFQASRAAHEEALAIRRKLAADEPRIYQPDVAGTLHNLGVVLQRIRQFPASCAAYEEALAIRRDLATDEPRIYRPHVAGTLNNLGAVRQEMRQFPASCTAYEEALAIRRDLTADEPHIYQPDVAGTLNNLGAVLREMRQFPASRAAHEEALAIQRELAADEPDIYRSNVAGTLNNLGNVLREMRQFPASRGAYEEALATYRELAVDEPSIYRPDVAGTLNNLGNVLREMRQFPASRAAYDESLAIRRELAADEPRIYQSDVATTLNNLSVVLREMRQFPASCGACEEALAMYRELAADEPRIYRPYVATTLHNLGNSLADMRQFPASCGACEEALAIRRELAADEPCIYRPDVAGTLNSLGTMLQRMRRFPASRRAYEEALAIRRELAADEPRVYRPDVAVTLNNLGGVLREMHQFPAALEVADQSVALVEGQNVPEGERGLLKGQVLGAYQALLHNFTRDEQRNDIYRVFGALREVHVLLHGSEAGDSLADAREALADLDRRYERRFSVLLVQNVSPDGMVVGVLTAEGLQAECSSAFRQKGEDLFTEVQDDSSRGSKHNGKVEHLAREAWEALSGFVREALCPGAGDSEVLISGDQYWMAFPWEGLRFGQGPTDYLGLHRSLGRWGPITAPAIDRIHRLPLGGGQRTACVICPYDTNVLSTLLGTFLEGVEAFGTLSNLGYTACPEPGLWTGTSATGGRMEELLAASPTIIHFTGHGAITGNEEVLVLHEDSTGRQMHLFGQMQLEMLKEQLGRERLLPNRPLVVLNSCHTGRTRTHGGQREDLTAAMLAEGAEAVIASPIPVYDNVGKVLGQELYAARNASADGIGQTVVNVRRRLADGVCGNIDSPAWGAWMMIHVHGNPLAYLPHATMDDEGGMTDDELDGDLMDTM